MINTKHTLIIGSCENMQELDDQSIHLIITSPPYFNAPFDYQDLYNSYDEYLELLTSMAKESFRVLHDGRIFALNIDDMLVNGRKFPIPADAIKIFQKAGFRYRDRIIWKKPDGYIRISKRSGVVFQNSYPMYFYPDNLVEHILIFQKGEFNYKSIDLEVKENSKINIQQLKKERWYMTLWNIRNVMPNSKLEKGIAAFPYEIPYRLITLFSYKGDTVLDPFVGSGTTMLAARDLNRNSIGFEVLPELENVIKEKIGFGIEKKLLHNQKDEFRVIHLK